MNRLFKQLQKSLTELRQRESAQREFLRSIYSKSNQPSFDYEKPAYLRRASTITLSSG